MNHYDIIANSRDRDTWLAARSEHLTASDIGTVLGVNPWESALSLYARKAGILPEKDQTEAMEMGLELEPVIFRLYTKRTGRKVTPAGELLRSREYPWLAATLDAQTEIGVKSVPLEAKAPGFAKLDDWESGVPGYYLPQVQAQMIVTGTDEASVAAVIGGQRFRWADVHRDDEAVRRIVEVGYEFWCRVREGRPPDPDGSDASAEALAAMFPQEEAEKSVVLSLAALEATDNLALVEQRLKELERERAECRQIIESEMGDATFGVIPGDNKRWRWATVSKKEYVVRAKTYRELRRVSAGRK